jgi:hypothetical protein
LDTSDIDLCEEVKFVGDPAEISEDDCIPVMNSDGATSDEAKLVKRFGDNTVEAVCTVGNSDRTAGSESASVKFPDEIGGEDSGTGSSPKSVEKSGGGWPAPPREGIVT